MVGVRILVLLALTAWSAGQAFADGADSCQSAFNNECDEPRYAGSGACTDGTDTADCSAIEALMSSVSPGADDSCRWAFDQACDDADLGGVGACVPGTDRSDCAFLADGAGDHCYWANDGECDEPRFGGTGSCTDGSDTTDCQQFLLGQKPGLSPIPGGFGGDNSCQSALDNWCDEPRYAGSGACTDGTDTADCSAIEALMSSVSPGADDSCRWAFDQACDDADLGGAGACVPGTDRSDCAFLADGAGDHCYWANDGECDEPRFGGTGSCTDGSDTTDCQQFLLGQKPGLSPIPGGFGGDNSCQSALDNWCDEPRYAGSGACPNGTDTADCSATEALMKSVSPSADDSCQWAFDQTCDDPDLGGTGFCAPGTDRSDCAFLAAGDHCYWANDGECDEPRFGGTGSCTDGSDTTDCAAVVHLRDRDNSCPTAFNDICDESSGGCAPLTDTADCLGRGTALDVADQFLGWDDRELVDARSFPWRTIGQVHFPDGACTATLIGPDLLITAAHCFFGSDDRGIAPEYFLLGQNGDDYTARGTIRRYYVSPDYNPSAEAPLGEGNDNDWGFIQIDEALGDQYGHMTVLTLDDEIRGTLLSADDLAIRQAGYSWDTGNHLSGHVGCRILEFLSDDAFLHECDTTAGDSGSPLFVLRGDTADIVGIDSQSLLDIDIQSLLDIDFQSLSDTDIQFFLDKVSKRVSLAVAASAFEQPLLDFINGAGISVETGAASNGRAGE